jgi:glycosyltransferase involved in cell wall biosynthesis
MDQNVVIPQLSVLMPVYNASAFLQDAIQSVLDQTFIDFEFIIMNDGSTDDSEKIILSFQDKRIRYIKNDANLKLIKTLNLGFTLALGKYIARIDADDICLPNRFEKQIAFLEIHPEIGVLGSSASIIDEHNQVIGNCIYPNDHDVIALDLVRYNPMIHPSVMMRTSILKEQTILFDEHFVHAEDYELWTRLITKTRFANLPEKLLLYRKHSSQISSVHTDEQLKLNKEISLNYLKSFGWFDFKGITWYFSLNEKDRNTFKDGLMAYQSIYNENRKQKFFSTIHFENQLKKRFFDYCLDQKTMSQKNYKLVKKLMVLFSIELTIKQKISLLLKVVRN